jgi:predicted nucleic acid-binding protein
MATRTFFDTNVLVYLFDADSPDKQAQAQDALQAAVERGAAVISTQVLQEFFVTVTRKLARPLPAREAEAALRGLMELSVVPVDPELILAAASAAGCEEVLSEDLQHGQSFGRVRIANPFRAWSRPGDA